GRFKHRTVVVAYRGSHVVDVEPEMPAAHHTILCSIVRVCRVAALIWLVEGINPCGDASRHIMDTVCAHTARLLTNRTRMFRAQRDAIRLSRVTPGPLSLLL